jgi:hypothetical protein
MSEDALLDEAPQLEPPHGLPARVLDLKRFRMRNHGPRRREAAWGHCPNRAKWSRARIIAGLSGFLTLIQSRDGPDR